MTAGTSNKDSIPPRDSAKVNNLVEEENLEAASLPQMCIRDRYIIVKLLTSFFQNMNKVQVIWLKVMLELQGSQVSFW